MKAPRAKREEWSVRLPWGAAVVAGWCGYVIGSRGRAPVAASPRAAPRQEQLAPRVVVVCAMPSELERWIERLPLGERLEFPGGAGRGPLRWNASLGVLGVATGEGARRAATSVTALGYDARFELRSSYWLFAGIAGVDPAAGSIGSAFWARAIVDAEAGNMFDAREIPPSFNGTTILPSDRDAPFGAPPPTDAEAEGMVYDISALADRAFAATRDLSLPDDAALRALRAQYAPGPATAPPAVRLGNVASSTLFWAGNDLTLWARRWHDYWLRADGGAFATTAMEDSAIAMALRCLTAAARADASRFLVLRTASDYSAQPPGADLVDWFYSDSHFAEDQALEAAYLVGHAFLLDLFAALDAPNPPQSGSR